MSNKRFATLDSVKKDGNKGNNDSGGGESSDEDKGQSFYVGGSERSGQEVLGPPRRDDRSSAAGMDDMTSRVFEAARAHGATLAQGEEEDSAGGNSSANSVYFRGGGYKLGDRVRPSTRLAGSSAGQEQNNSQMQPVTLRMWTNGFSIDDGPLRPFTDPENRNFLQSIMIGRIPNELTQQYPGKEIDLKMERKTEEFSAPKPKPFSGQGQRLGGIVPNMAVSDSFAASVTDDTVDFETRVREAQNLLKLNEDVPTTRIQIRLPNAKRIQATFNHSQTVSDVRAFIVAAQPHLAYQSFALMTGFPPKEILDEMQSLADAAVLNSVLDVKLN